MAAPAPPTPTTYLTPPQIAARLRLRQQTVLGWIHTGRLRAFNVGGGHERPRYRVHEADLEIFLATLAVNPAPAQTRRRRQKDSEVIEFIS